MTKILLTQVTEKQFYDGTEAHFHTYTTMKKITSIISIAEMIIRASFHKIVNLIAEIMFKHLDIQVLERILKW